MRRPRWKRLQGLALSLISLCAGVAAADVWTEPSPFRREALIEGRDFTYNSEAFLQRFSYRHLSREPTTDRDGVSGTGGSVTSDRLYLDIHLQKTLRFDDERHGVYLRMQRFEDFDGEYNRQIVGIERSFGTAWRLALSGDVQSSKGDSDVQLEASWAPDEERLLRFIYIRPDLFLNSKGDDTERYLTEPQTLFLQYRQPIATKGFAELVVNHSPTAVLADQTLGLEASGRSTRMMTRGLLPLPGRLDPAAVGFRVELEDTDRDFDWDDPPALDADQFERRTISVDLALELPDLRWSPSFGYYGFRMREDGWFGTGLATTGRVSRDEHYGYAGLLLRPGKRHFWEPAVSFGHVDLERRFDQRTGDDRDESEWIGKLAVPWRYVVNQQANAILTVNLTFRLHEARFGGGNLQLHWPL